MATNQEAIISALQTELGAGYEDYTYESLWHALWDAQSIDGADFNARMLNWINGKLASSHADLPGAMQAFADDAGFYNWGSMDSIDVTAAP